MDPVDHQQVYIYSLGPGDLLESVNDDRVAFAAQNGAGHLSREAVVGRPLFSFIAGAETRELYRMIMGRVRQSGRRAVIAFRCDSPGARRFMELELSPLDGNRVQYSGRILREEFRSPERLLDTAVDRSDELVTVCSRCKRVKVSDE